MVIGHAGFDFDAESVGRERSRATQAAHCSSAAQWSDAGMSERSTGGDQDK